MPTIPLLFSLVPILLLLVVDEVLMAKWPRNRHNVKFISHGQKILIENNNNDGHSGQGNATVLNKHANLRTHNTEDVTQKQLETAQKCSVDPKWVGSDGGLLYPPNHGFGKSMETDLVLEPGTQIDRYGRNGRFFAPAGTPFEHRSLPPSAIKSDYTVYEVLKPLYVRVGRAVPWFDFDGGAFQYRTNVRANDLIDQGFLKLVKAIKGSDIRNTFSSRQNTGIHH